LALAAITGLAFAGPLAAQQPPAAGAPAGQQAPVDAPPIRHIKLTPDHIKQFIAVEPAMAAIAKKYDIKPEDSPKQEVKDELEKTAKANGFANYFEYLDVATNISMSLGGVDENGKAVDPIVQINKEIAEIEAEKSIDAEQKKLILKELAEALDNARLVGQHRAAIEKVLQ
jgi:hypothetical protein